MMKALIHLLFCVSLILFFAACSCRSESKTVVLMENARSDYAIVYPQDYLEGGDCQTALKTLEDNIRQNANGAIIFKSDYLAEGDSPDRLEILIGKTNRPESKKAAENLRENDYFIGFTNGKLTVVGGSAQSTATAILHFNALFFKETQDSLVLPENYALRINGEYEIDKLSILGHTANEIGILYDASTEKDALALQNGIRKLTGHTLPLYTTEEDNRPPFTLTITSADCELSISDGAITLSHSDAGTRSERVCALLAKLRTEKDIRDSSFPNAAESERLSLLSLNVSEAGYGENAVTLRYPRLMTLLLKNEYPDILTLQNVSPAWMEEFDKAGENYPALTELYDSVGIGRNGDDNSVKNPIFYRKDKLTLIDSGNFWLSDTPTFASIGWDGRERAIASYAILEQSATGEKFAVINTALDRYGETARANGIALILQYADTFDCPVLIAGDMQSDSRDEPIGIATKYRFSDSECLAKESDHYEGATVNGAFGSNMNFSNKSDFVLTSYGDFTVYNHIVDRTKINGGYISNHWAIFVEFSTKFYKK